MSALEQQLVREATVENAELSSELRMIEARTRLQGFAARYIARLLVVFPIVLVVYLTCKVVLLRKTYPVAFAHGILFGRQTVAVGAHLQGNDLRNTAQALPPLPISTHLIIQPELIL